MRIKGIAKKIAIKASGIFLRFPGIYSVVSSSVRGKHSELPSCEWARHVLREASPSPCPQKKGGGAAPNVAQKPTIRYFRRHSMLQR